ncbi:MAG: hypothetical protein NC095_05310 [Muribaculum sp.]|nr:hypothetical protein [Muribaculum sp.]
MNTKNISLLGLGLFAAVAFSSCDKIEESLAKPIENPQLPIFNSETVVYSPVADINVSDPSTSEIMVATCTATDLPEGFTFGGTLQLSPAEDFSKVIEVRLKSVGDELYVNSGDLAALYSSDITKDPATVNLYGRTSLTASDGSDAVHIGTLDTFYGVGSYKFTPVAADHYIAPAYYIVMGDGANWDYANAVKVSNSGISPYDDPVFVGIVNKASDRGDKWFLIGEDNYNKVKGGTSLAGLEYYVPVFDRTENGLSYGDLDRQDSGNFNAATMPAMQVPVEMTIDAQKLTYSFKSAVEAYYATGNGWSNWGEHWMAVSTTNFADYYGFLNLDSEFKFAPQAGWGSDFGAASPLTEEVSNGLYNYTGIIHDSGDNIKLGHSGLFFAHLNVNDWTLGLGEVKTIGMTGDFNGWGADIEMTPSADLYTWTADLTVEAGQGWKFRANSDWAINLGGTPDALWNNGDNIVLPEAGTYTITLNVSTYPAKFTAVKK